MTIDKQRDINGIQCLWSVKEIKPLEVFQLKDQVKQGGNKETGKEAFKKSLSEFLKDGDGTREDWQRLRDRERTVQKLLLALSYGNSKK